jgi:hypothetical protein
VTAASFRSIIRTAAVAVVCSVLVLGSGATAAQAASYQGCDTGYVCLYPENRGWNNGRPSHRWYYYGTYNLSNVYGVHRIFNNQTLGADLWLCWEYDGGECLVRMTPGAYADLDFTPINSIKLTS